MAKKQSLRGSKKDSPPATFTSSVAATIIQPAGNNRPLAEGMVEVNVNGLPYVMGKLQYERFYSEWPLTANSNNPGGGK